MPHVRWPHRTGIMLAKFLDTDWLSDAKDSGRRATVKHHHQHREDDLFHCPISVMVAVMVMVRVLVIVIVMGIGMRVGRRRSSRATRGRAARLQSMGGGGG